MEYNICGKISFFVDFDVEADNEELAIEKAKTMILDYYHLSVVNAYHNSQNIKFNIDAYDYEE